jgi:hypothetical protein
MRERKSGRESKRVNMHRESEKEKKKKKKKKAFVIQSDEHQRDMRAN